MIAINSVIASKCFHYADGSTVSMDSSRYELSNSDGSRPEYSDAGSFGSNGEDARRSRRKDEVSTRRIHTKNSNRTK